MEFLTANEAVYTALEALRPEDFYRPVHAILFKAMTELESRARRNAE